MEGLSEKIGETIHLALGEGLELIHLYKADSLYSLRLLAMSKKTFYHNC